MSGYVLLAVSFLLHFSSNVNAFNGRCPAEWTLYENSCYKLYKTPPRSFPDAQSTCENDHGALTSISSAKENDFLNEIKGRSEHFWIGLNDIQEEGVFQWMDGTQFRYSLDNNTNQNHGNSDGVFPLPEPSTSPNYVYNHDAELDFSMWKIGQPDMYGNSIRNQDCVYFNSYGSWNDFTCASIFYYMCEKNAHEEGTLAETTIKCPHSFETVFELGASSKIVTWSEPAYLSNSLASHVARSHSTGAEFHTGVTWVNYTFSDPYNNTATCNFSIAVLEVDTTPPTIKSCPPDVTVTKITNVPLIVTWEPPVATDLSESVTLVSQSHFPGDEVELGLNNVTYKFSDDSGNEAFCFFNIYMFDVNNSMESLFNTDTYVANNSGNNESRDTDDKSSGLFTGLYIIVTFIGVALVLVLLKLIRTKSDSGIGKLSYARLNGDADVDILI